MPYNYYTAQVRLQLDRASVQAVQRQIRDGLRNSTASLASGLGPEDVSRLRTYSDALSRARASAADLDRAGRGLTGGLASARTTAAALSRGMLDVGESTARTARAFGTVHSGAKLATDSMEGFARQAGLAARRYAAFALASGTMLRVASEIKSAVAEAVKFDREIVRLRQVSDGSARQVGALAAEVGRLARAYGVSSTELMRTSVVFTQAGLRVDEVRDSLEAVAKAALAPNFDSMAQTAEGAIAVFKQFKVQGKDLEGVLGSMNAVAGAFAVEAGDLIDAVRRVGGVFASVAGDAKHPRDALNELFALVTAVRSATREDASVIANGLKTIFTRIQRPEVVDTLKELGVHLRYTRKELEETGNSTALEGRFVGAWEAVRRLSEALSSIPSTDPRFNRVLEQVGGVWQLGRAVPLIQQFAEAQRALAVAQAGQASLTANAAQAQDALAVQITKVKENWLDLGRAVADSQGFRTAAESIAGLSSGLADLLKYAAPLVPALTALAGVKIGQALWGATAAFASDRSSGTRATGVRRFAAGGTVPRVVPGVGYGDKVPALLEPGELVVPRNQAQRFAGAGPVVGEMAVVQRLLARHGYGDVRVPGLARNVVFGGRPLGFFDPNSVTLGMNPAGMLRNRRSPIDVAMHELFHAANRKVGGQLAPDGTPATAFSFTDFGAAAERARQFDALRALVSPGVYRTYVDRFTDVKNPQHYLDDEAVAQAVGLHAWHRASPKAAARVAGADRLRIAESVAAPVIPLITQASREGDPAREQPGAYNRLLYSIRTGRLAGGGPVARPRVRYLDEFHGIPVVGGRSMTPEVEMAINAGITSGLPPALVRGVVTHARSAVRVQGVWGEPRSVGWGEHSRVKGSVLHASGSLGTPTLEEVQARVAARKSPAMLSGISWDSRRPDDVLASQVWGASTQTSRAYADVNRRYRRSTHRAENFGGADGDIDYATESVVVFDPRIVTNANYRNNHLGFKDWVDRRNRDDIIKTFSRFPAGGGRLGDNPDFKLLTRAVMKDPAEATTKLVLADAVQELAGEDAGGLLRRFIAKGRFAAGGPVGLVPGTGNADTVPVDLPVGSYVIRKASTRAYGVDNLEELARTNRYAAGGSVPALVMPGEYVFGPGEARRIGRHKLDRINRYASGGPVRLADGGDGMPPPPPGVVAYGRQPLVDNAAELRASLANYIRSVDAGVSEAEARRQAGQAHAKAIQEATRAEKSRAKAADLSTQAANVDRRATAMLSLATEREAAARASAAKAAEARKGYEGIDPKDVKTGHRGAAGRYRELREMEARSLADAENATKGAAAFRGDAGRLQQEAERKRVKAAAVNADAADVEARNAVLVSQGYNGVASYSLPGAERAALAGASVTRAGPQTALGLAQTRADERLRNFKGFAPDSVRQGVFDDELAKVKGDYVRATANQIRAMDRATTATRAAEVADDMWAKGTQNNSLQLATAASGRVAGDASLRRPDGSVVQPMGWWDRRKTGFMNAFRGGDGGYGFTNTMNSGGAMGLMMAAPILTQLAREGLGADDPSAVAKGAKSAGLYTAGSAVAEATSLGLTGAVAGSLLLPAKFAGPAALAAGLAGLSRGVHQASQQINEARLGLAVERVSAELNLIARGFKTFDGRSAGLLRGERGEIDERLLEKAKDEATYLTLFGARVIRSTGGTRTLYEQHSKSEANKQIPHYVALLNDRLLTAARLPANRDRSPADLLGGVMGENDGFFRDLVPEIARVLGKTAAEVDRDNLAQARTAVTAARSDDANKQLAAFSARASVQLEHLAQAARTVTASLEQSAEAVALHAGMFDGEFAPPRVASLTRRLDNPAGETPGAYGGLVESAAGPLGGPEKKRLGEQARAISYAARALPGVLASVNAGRKPNDNPVEMALQLLRGGARDEGVIPSGFLSGAVRPTGQYDRVEKILRATFDSGEGFDKFSAKLGDDPDAVAREGVEALMRVLGGVREIAGSREGAATAYAGGLRDLSGRSAQVRDQRYRADQAGLALAQVRAEGEARRRGADPSRAADLLTADQVDAPWRNMQQSLVPGGRDAFDPAALRARLDELATRIPEAVAYRDASVGDDKMFRIQARRVETLQDEYRRLTQAMRNLAEPTNAAAGSMRKLQQIQAEEEGRLGAAEQVATEDYEQRYQRRRGERLANQVAAGNVRRLNPEDARAMFSAARAYGQARVFNGKDGTEVIREYLRATQPEVANLPAGRAAERDAHQARVEAAAAAAEKAQREIVGIQEGRIGAMRGGVDAGADRAARELEVAKAVNSQDRVKGEQTLLSKEIAKRRPLAANLAPLREIFGDDLTPLRTLSEKPEAYGHVAGLSEKYKANHLAREQVKRLGVSFVETLGVEGVETKPLVDELRSKVPDRSDRFGRFEDPTPYLNYLSKAGRIDQETYNAADKEFRSSSYGHRTLEGLAADLAVAARARADGLGGEVAGHEEALRNLNLMNAGGTGPLDRYFHAGAGGSLNPDQLKQSADALAAAPDLAGKTFEEVSASVKETSDRFDELTRKIADLGKAVDAARDRASGATPAPSDPFKAALGDLGFHAAGGPVGRGRPRGTDTVPAMLSPGEFVVSAGAARANRGLLERVNRAKGPVYLAGGGSVGWHNYASLFPGPGRPPERRNGGFGWHNLASLPPPGPRTPSGPPRGGLGWHNLASLPPPAPGSSAQPPQVAPMPRSGRRIGISDPRGRFFFDPWKPLPAARPRPPASPVTPGRPASNIVGPANPGAVFGAFTQQATPPLPRLPSLRFRMGRTADLADARPGSGFEQSLLDARHQLETNRLREWEAAVAAKYGGRVPPNVERFLRQTSRQLHRRQESAYGLALTLGAGSTANLASYALSGLGDREILGLGRPGVESQRRLEAGLSRQAQSSNFASALRYARDNPGRGLAASLVRGMTDRPLRRAAGGSVPGVGMGDRVPSLLTPGEFVFNRSATAAIGPHNLSRMQSEASGGSEGSGGSGFAEAVDKFLKPCREFSQAVQSFDRSVGRFDQAVQKLSDITEKFQGTVRVEGTQVVQHTGSVILTGEGTSHEAVAEKVLKDSDAEWKRRYPDLF